MTLVITDLDVGGAERALVALARGLDRRRWRPSVLALGPHGKLADELASAGIDTECLGLTARSPLRGVMRLAAAMRKRRPWLVQSFLFHANVTTRLAAPLAGRPWVLSGLRVAEREKAWHLRLDRLTSRLSVGAVCVSEGVRRFSIEVAGLNPDRLTVIPNGVDQARFEGAQPLPRAQLGVSEDAPLTLFVGRLVPQKGIEELLRAARVVSARRPFWRLLIAGDGPLRDRLAALSRDEPALAAAVRWLGPRDDVPRLLRSADILVLPSLWEGMPNVVLEAMAAGLPVLGTQVEGTEELVVPGQTGWLVPPGDSEALAAALLEAIDNPTDLKARGERGRLRVRERYSQQQVVAAYDRLWSTILGYQDSDPTAVPVEPP